MRKILNTIYITNPKAYLSEKHENIVITVEDKIVAKYPLLDLERVVSFSFLPISPRLLLECGKRDIEISFVDEFGGFAGSFIHRYNSSSVITRKEQFRKSEDPIKSLKISQEIINTKAQNSYNMLLRLNRDNKSINIDDDLKKIKRLMKDIDRTVDKNELLGVEGNIAKIYFSNFNNFIKQDGFYFEDRNKRPPRDPINSLLSFFYTILTAEYTSAIYATGLDPEAGFYHVDQSNRNSLSCDLMEELRSVLVDRFVISQINNKVVSPDDFEKRIDKTYVLKPDAKKKLLVQWEKRKREEIIHPIINERVEIGLIPYIQSMLLSKYIRNEMPEYKGFIWR